MKIDENFVKGTAYYIGDGRTKTNRGLSTVNQDSVVIKFFLKWLKEYFDIGVECTKIHIKMNVPNFSKTRIKKEFGKMLGITSNIISSVKLKHGAKPHHKILIEVCANNSLAKEKFDKLIPKVKSRCIKNKKLALAYLKGIMAAEGSPKYHKESGSRNIHLKMKNEQEIKYLGNLLNNTLGIKSSVLKVNNEEGMWLITISGYYGLNKLNEWDLFEIESRKRKRFEEIVGSYKRAQVKKGDVAEFYIEKLNYFNGKMNKRLTAPELAKLLKRDRTRTIFVLRNLERKKLIKSKRRNTTGRPFEFWLS